MCMGKCEITLAKSIFFFDARDADDRDAEEHHDEAEDDEDFEQREAASRQ